jgi:flagellar hook protein FlgE
MASFSIPLSGLTASSLDLSSIANNLANMNTVGYYGTNTVFQDLLYQNIGTSGAGDPMQLGAGVEVSSMNTNFTEGSIENTGVPSDVAIMGSGFFVCQNNNGSYEYTRAGDFSVNSSGTLVSEDGMPVMGYPAQNGVVNTGAAVGPLQLGQGQVSQPNATTTVSMNMNLDASTAAGGSFSTPMTVYDSLGQSHTLNFTFTNTSAGNWDYQITLPAADTGSAKPTVLASGSLAFDSSGQLTSTTPISGITLPKSTSLADGAANLNITWDLANSNGPLITQLASPSNTASTSQDGYSGGTLTSFAINTDGTVNGTYSNGQTMVLGQLALANFSNPQGLSRDGSNNFSATVASGAAAIGTPGSGGLGTVAGGSLELSNVDISTQFSNMIEAQRDFEANARAVTTFDQVMQDTIGLVPQNG